MGRLLQTAPAIVEVDVNPLMVRAQGQGATALDALIVAELGYPLTCATAGNGTAMASSGTIRRTAPKTSRRAAADVRCAPRPVASIPQANRAPFLRNGSDSIEKSIIKTTSYGPSLSLTKD